MRRILAVLLCAILWAQPVLAAGEDGLMLQEEAGQSEEREGGTQQQGVIGVSAPSAILMEASTGQVIYEKDADSARPPASVTKIMTLLLIFDALAEGKLNLTDEVVTSEYAASMGGSQVFLEAGEAQTAETMIKCISVASANDACAAFGFGIIDRQITILDKISVIIYNSTIKKKEEWNHEKLFRSDRPGSGCYGGIHRAGRADGARAREPGMQHRMPCETERIN